MNRRLLSCLTILFVFLLVLLPGCGEPVDGDVHVDNGSDELIVVFVDGKQEARIGPGRCRKLTLPLGNREFKITRDDEVIYEKSHRLETGDRLFHRPTYVLNPDQSNRYCKVKVVYHEEGHGDSDLADLITMISNSIDKTEGPIDADGVEDYVADEGDDTEAPDVEGDEKTAQEERQSERAIIRQYREVASGLVAMGDQPFFEIENSGTLFKPLPTVVYSRQSGDQSRSTLARIPKVLHDYIAEAGRVKRPTAEELERLKVAQEVTISYVPFR